MSSYFPPRDGATPTNLFGKSGQKAAKAATTAPVKTIKVRAHTRAVPAKKEKPAPDLNTASVRPSNASTDKRFAPNFAKEPIAGYVQVQVNPDGSVAHSGSYQPGVRMVNRPYYTNTHTLRHFAGPTGDESTQLNAAQVAKAKQIQRANYGTPGYIARSLVPGGLDSGATSVADAVVRGVQAGSLALPGGGVTEAAGLFGLGLRGLRIGRAAKDVTEAAPEITKIALRQQYVDQQLRAIKVAKDQISGKIPRRFAPGIAEGDLTVAQKRLAGAKKLLAEAKAEAASRPTPAAAKPVAPAPHTTEEAAVIRAAMPGAKATRKAQEAGYSVARSERVAAGNVHLDNPNLSADEAFARAKAELRGPLPKINFLGFGDLTPSTLESAITTIRNHPNLQFFQKVNARDAIVNALDGTTPTNSELLLLEHIFGKGTGDGLVSLAKDPFRDVLVNILNIPRSLMASFDLSAPFRQGLMVATRHPAIFAKNFGPMLKAFGNEAVYHAGIDEIRARPTFPLMVEAKVPFTEIGSDVGMREEHFASSYAETLTGGKYSPVRASGRAYTMYLDKVRADVFDHLIAKAQRSDINLAGMGADERKHFLESLGRYIGSATGRGDLRHFQEAAKVLNAFFFSPRLMASRFNFLNPAYYYRLHPFARREALRSALQLAGTATTLVALASEVPGVKVATDPRNPDWGKMHIGNTRIDIGGGFQQPLRLLAQIGTGVAISSTTGKRLNLTTGGFGQPTRLDLALRFFQGKESPIASLVTDWARGSNQIGQPFSWQTAAVQRMTPLLGQDAYDLYKEQHGGMNGLMAALAGYGIGSVGIGVQTYGPPAPKPASGSAGYFGGSNSGGGGYFSGTSTSGGSPYFSSP